MANEMNTIEIKKTSREFTKVEQYLMTLDNGITSMKDIPDGTTVMVDGWLEFVDHKKDGDVELMAILSTDGKAYSTQSMTFKRSIHNIENIMDGQKYGVIKTSGTTKAGRPFIDCSLDVNSLQ